MCLFPYEIYIQVVRRLFHLQPSLLCRPKSWLPICYVPQGDCSERGGVVSFPSSRTTSPTTKARRDADRSQWKLSCKLIFYPVIFTFIELSVFLYGLNCQNNTRTHYEGLTEKSQMIKRIYASSAPQKLAQ